MKKYNNRGIDMGGLSLTDPEKYRKINYVLNDKGVHTDLLDVIETVPLEYAYDLADEKMSPEEEANLSELKSKVTHVLSSLTARRTCTTDEVWYGHKGTHSGRGWKNI